MTQEAVNLRIELEARLRFEMIQVEISTGFINMSDGQLNQGMS
jgi:hypothetical protein